jgi:hypothetical protein
MWRCQLPSADRVGKDDPEQRDMGAPALTQGERENEQRRAVEALAQALYEAEDPGGIAWTKRAQIIREPWIARARRQLIAAPPPL